MVPMSAQPLFLEGEVLSVSHDNMVQKVDIHQFAGPFDSSCQVFVGMTGGEIA